MNRIISRVLAASMVFLMLGSAQAQHSAPMPAPFRDPVVSYDLTMTLHPDQHALDVTGEIELPPQSDASDSMQLTISATAASVAWRSTEPDAALLEASAATPEGGQVTWTIRKAREAGRSTRLRFSYRIAVPEAVGFLYVGPQLSFGSGSFYPHVGDSDAIGIVRIRAPLSGELFTGGRAVATRQEGAFQIRTFQNTMPVAKLFFAFVPDAQVTGTSAPNISVVTLRKRPGDSEWGKGVVDVAAALEAEFGQVPFERVTIFEVPNAISDKAGFGAFATSGAVFARSGYFDQPFNVGLFAHEMSHFWWGNNVAREGAAGDFLLDEGLSQYGSISAVERVVGPAAGTQFRRQGWPGFNENLWSGSAYLQMADANFD